MLASLVILDYQGDVFITVPSSSGLGHRPLTARTGVRVSLGSPMQAAGIKTCRFSLFSKAFSEFECCNFKNCILGSFSELVCQCFFVFQDVEWVGISLGLRDYLLSKIRYEKPWKKSYWRWRQVIFVWRIDTLLMSPRDYPRVKLSWNWRLLYRETETNKSFSVETLLNFCHN